MEDLRERVISIKENEGISYKHICKQIDFEDEPFFCRWRKGKPGFVLNSVIEKRLDEFLISKGY